MQTDEDVQPLIAATASPMQPTHPSQQYYSSESDSDPESVRDDDEAALPSMGRSVKVLHDSHMKGGIGAGSASSRQYEPLRSSVNHGQSIGATLAACLAGMAPVGGPQLPASSNSRGQTHGSGNAASLLSAKLAAALADDGVDGVGAPAASLNVPPTGNPSYAVVTSGVSGRAPARGASPAAGLDSIANSSSNASSRPGSIPATAPGPGSRPVATRPGAAASSTHSKLDAVQMKGESDAESGYSSDEHHAGQDEQGRHPLRVAGHLGRPGEEVP